MPLLRAAGGEIGVLGRKAREPPVRQFPGSVHDVATE